MKKLLAALLTILILLSVFPTVSAASVGNYGWYGDTEDFQCWELSDGCTAKINSGTDGNRRIWREAVTDTDNFCVRVTCEILTGRAYLSFMGAVVELNKDGGSTNYLYTNVGTQWFYAADYTATVTFSRQNGGNMTVCISGNGNSSSVVKQYSVSNSAQEKLFLGTYEQTASACFSMLRSVSGTSEDWSVLTNYWALESAAARCDNTSGTSAQICVSKYFTGAFTLSYRLDFTEFYLENRIGSVRIGLCETQNTGVWSLFDLTVEKNGKNTLGLSYWENDVWNVCGSKTWDDSDAGKYDNSYYVEISRSGENAPIVFTLYRSDHCTVVGSPMSLDGMSLERMDTLHTVRMEFYNCECTCSELCLTQKSGGEEIPAWDADPTAFGAYGDSGLIAFGSGKIAYQFVSPASDTYGVYASFSFGSGAETRKVLLADKDKCEIVTAVIRKAADGLAVLTLEKDGSPLETTPASYQIYGMNDKSATLYLTKLQGTDTLVLGFDNGGITAENVADLGKTAAVGVSADTACVFSAVRLTSYTEVIPMTETLLASAARGDGTVTPDISYAEAVHAYENLMANYLDADNNRLYPVEGGYRNGFEKADGSTVVVNRAGELWEAYILLSAMDTYAKLYEQGSPAWTEVAQRIANTMNFFADSYTEAELTTAGTSPCNHAMDDSCWSDAALILGYRYNLALGDTERAAQFLDLAVKLFHSIYEVFYDDALGGGTWYNRAESGKSLYAAMAAIDGWDLAELTQDDTIRREMQDIYAGIENNLRRADGLYWCDIRYTGYAGIGNPYGINEAGSVSFFGCNMAMAILNARLGYTDKAAETAAALTLYDTTDEGIYVNDRDAWVNAVFAGRWAEELLKSGLLDEAYSETLRRTAASILENAVLPDGYYSPSWSGPCEPTADGWPADYEGVQNRWSKAGNGTVPRQMMTSSTTAHMIFAAALLGEASSVSPAAFGWSSDSENFSGWYSENGQTISADYARQENHRIWKSVLPEDDDYSVTVDITVNAEASAYIRVGGVTLELDGRHGTGQQAYIKLAGTGVDWLSAENATVHVQIGATEEGFSCTLTGAGNAEPMLLTASKAEMSNNLEIGLFAGSVKFRNLRISLPNCTHKNTELRNASAADCTTAGYTGDTYCTDCGELISEGTAIAALGHNFVDGKCTRCDAEDPDYEAKDPCEGYTDIDRKAWYHTAADFVIASGLMGSTKADTLTFEPNTKVSRAMVASILYRMADTPDVEYQGIFTDVPAGKWFTDAVEWCAQNGLASGKGNGKFDPNGNVTRQELAVFMKKMAEYLKEDTTATANLSTFADGEKVPAWAKDYISWAVAAGLISGKASNGQTYLAPTDNATRAELAVILRNFLKNISIE